jgi:predicted dehydrogenase
MSRPTRCALIGIGTRARKLYLPILQALAPWIEICAICTPDATNAAETGTRLGVPAFTSLTELLDANLIEAAIVLSTIESHHAISVTLSRRGIHHLVETTMASTLAQARQMVDEARINGVTLLVAENYFRFPFDRLAKAVSRSGLIGDVHRISCYQDQVGFHGHARWLRFYDAYPVAVQAFAHKMPTARHVESANRIHESETFRACHLFFTGDRVAIDMGGNAKGLIGRTPRPGFTEIDGTRGAIVRTAGTDLDGVAELRVASDMALARDGKADHVAAFCNVVEDGTWISSSVNVPDGIVEVANPHRPGKVTGKKIREWDAAVVMEIVVEFADEIRGIRPSEFSALDALKATEIEMACRESALRGGERIGLPTDGLGFESEAIAARAINDRFGIDPMDAEAMIAVHFPPAA